ncbi:MAG: hypothetical protein HXX16_02670 [Bacteroidales bacterium]|jgi:hypothetical protein|nr:hypothetical protein [Bacteroidales bacterium]
MEILSFGAWWEGLSAFTKIYWMIAIPASIIFIIQLGTSLLRTKANTEVLDSSKNAASDDKVRIPFQLVNFRNFIGFFTSLGWSGLACIDSGLSSTSTILTSFICGILVMSSMAVIFYITNKLMQTVEENL